MISVVIIGYGNVAKHLIDAFLKADNITVSQVYCRSINKIEHLKKTVATTNSLALLKDADLYIIAVSDDAIAAVSSEIKNKNNLVVHTSGSVSLDSLINTGRKGIFYPLQSFSKDKEVNFNEIPFCLEAENKDDLVLLEKAATAIGKKIYHINSTQRKQLHVAAVFVNNFVNHMYKIGHDVCNDFNVPFDVLHPLIKETAAKIEFLNPTEAQTGPAKRNDKKTIENHLDLLNDTQQKIYKLLTKSIQNG